MKSGGPRSDGVLGSLATEGKSVAAIKSDSTSALHMVQELPVTLERDVFLRTLIRELAGTIQDVVGLEEATGFVRVVG